MIRHNWKYKLLALAVALILWAHVNSERNPQSSRTFSVPVRTVGLARGYVAELDMPKVSVSIEGSKTAVEAVAKEDLEARVELGKLRLDRKMVRTSLPVEVPPPRAVESQVSVTVTPKRVGVRIEALEEKQMPVAVDFTSQPPAGYSYSNPLLTPDKVAVRGTVSALAMVKQAVLTLEGDPTGSATDGFYEVSAVDSAGNDVPGVTVRPAKVKAKLEMVEVPATKAVFVSPVFSGEPKFPLNVSRYTVVPSSVTLEGRPSKLAGISVVSTDKIVLDGADATVSKDVALRIPSGVKAIGGRTVKVTVYIGAN